MIKNIYYNGIKGLLKAGTEQNFTKQQIHEIWKSKNDVAYFLENYVKVRHLDSKQLIPFKLYDFQKRFIECINNNNRVLASISRQAGKTVGISGFILHKAIFESNQNIGIVANKGSTARKILKDIKNMYKSLPEWLQVGIEIWDKTSITLGNRTQILTDNTCADSFTGESLNLLVVDEVAKIERNLFMDFYDSAMPTVSSSKTAKIVMFSTSKGLNHWYKIFTDAKNGINEFKVFEIKWNDVPGRDEAFRNKIINTFGDAHWRQEYLCEFLGSSDSLVSMAKLQSMPHKNPLIEKYESKFKIYETPKKDYQYFALCDYSEGISEDNSVIQIMKKTDDLKFKQVAVYKDGVLKPREFASIKKIIGEYYNSALVIGESNSIGQESLNELFEEYEYENIFWDLSEKRTIGLRSTKKTKKLGNSYLKSFIENDKFEIVDFDTINELSTYVKKGSSYEADKSCHDDLVTPLVMFSYLLNVENFNEWWIEEYEMRKNDIKVEAEDILPVFSSASDEWDDF